MESSRRKTIWKKNTKNKIRLTKVRNGTGWGGGIEKFRCDEYFYHFRFMFAFSAEISSRFINYYVSDVWLFFAQIHTHFQCSITFAQRKESQSANSHQIKRIELWEIKNNLIHQIFGCVFVSAFLALNTISIGIHAKYRSRFARREENFIKNFENFRSTVWLVCSVWRPF